MFDLLPPRCQAKIERTDDERCWIWTGYIDVHGYGRFRNGKRVPMAHRFVYETLRGEIPVGLQIDHLCRVRNCVNPNHMEPVTSRENSLRSPISRASINASKTHCPAGHEYTPANTKPQGPGWRRCRECCKAVDRRRLARMRAAA